jgi:peptidyl-tRNA hydrolase, PTH1 family
MSPVIIKFYLERILVAYDDIALSLGKIRLRKKGSAGGHNGMKSIIESLGKEDFSRMRLGIGSPEGQPLEKYVLSAFSKSEEQLVENMLDTAQNACLEILSGGMDSAMNLYNGTETV